DHYDEADDTRLSNLQQLHATSFSLWTTSATDLSVASDMTVGSNAMVGSNLTVGAHVTVGGDVTLQGGQLDSTTGVVGLGGNTVVTGSDFVLGTDDGRTTGLRTQQRALVHDIDDTLTLNYRGDFEGGTQINSDTQITGNLTVNGTAQINGGTLKPEYHVTSTTYLNTIDLDMDRIEELCGDRGGCTVRLGMTRWERDTQTAAANRMYALYYSASDRRWRMSTDAHGQIGDGINSHLVEIYDTCYLTEKLYVSRQDRGDNGTGMKLLVWDGYSGSNRTCELTFID
ncbi:MAG: hypothetical protein AAFS10_25905, partial [Myxococcota bacterium]